MGKAKLVLIALPGNSRTILSETSPEIACGKHAPGKTTAKWIEISKATSRCTNGPGFKSGY